MKKIYLVRHGETESNIKGIFRGRLDIPLMTGSAGLRWSS
ncbi:MAG: hypothetical protein GTO45_39960 [Candidatus Aminicenantes bacterium]|nr:hypothetical protein [Candidatus Aminicenantes bacterium]NIM84795.1 hypothetical protein [Candidatus Aminicenantes bacterium]NIN24298.1 hypothetical protein [Candidatus Aminicenantes bacterium]NIN48057.1 hypothetical protein [Candidatus Aminicenantes bacterium]NIN90958.1 hypothetical protein [Candidatus Aminicenantes bacterium]